MVTDRDIALRVVAEGRDPQTTPVGEIATTQVSPAYPDESLNEALEQMAYRRVRRLPVIDNDRVVGILAQADVVLEVPDKKAGHLVEEISQPSAVSSSLEHAAVLPGRLVSSDSAAATGCRIRPSRRRRGSRGCSP